MQDWHTIRLLYAGKSIAGLFKLNYQGSMLKIMFWSFNLIKNPAQEYLAEICFLIIWQEALKKCEINRNLY
jgi:hypothetical protein